MDRTMYFREHYCANREKRAAQMSAYHKRRRANGWKERKRTPDELLVRKVARVFGFSNAEARIKMGIARATDMDKAAVARDKRAGGVIVIDAVWSHGKFEVMPC